MKIMIDWDGTFTANPQLFSGFISLAEAHGADCFIVTARNPENPIDLPEEHSNIMVVYTSGQAKIDYCRNELDLSFDIFIEDKPARIFLSAETAKDL